MDGKPDVDTSSFGAILRRHRGARGLTQEGLAERAGLHVQEISKLERGVLRRPRSTTVALLAEALRLETQERADFFAAACEQEVQDESRGQVSPDAKAPQHRGGAIAASKASAPQVHKDRGPRWTVTTALLCTLLAGAMAGAFVERFTTPTVLGGTQGFTTVGYPHTPDGAAEAVGNYLAAIGTDWLSQDRALDLHHKPVMTTRTPIAYRVMSYTNLTARVLVWLVTMAGVTDDQSQQMQANFSEGEATVVWLRGDWRLHEISGNSVAAGSTLSIFRTPSMAGPGPRIAAGFTPYG